MVDPTASSPSRIFRVGIVALILSVVFFWSGRTLEGFDGFALTMASLGCGAVGLGLTIAEAAEHLSHLERWRPRVPGRPHTDRSEGVVSLGRCGICNQRRIQRPGLVVCPTCDRHLTA